MDSETWKAARPLVIAGLILLFAVSLLLIVFHLRQFFAVLFLGMILGVALNPLVDTLGRFRVPRVASVLLVYVMVTIIFAIFCYYAFQEISNEAIGIEVDSLREDYEELRQGTALPPVEDVEDSLRNVAGQAASGLMGQAFTFIDVLISIFTLLFVALLFTVTEDRMRAVFLTFIPPANRGRAEEVLAKLAVGLRGFLRGELIAMVVIGTVTYIGLTILGIRLALVLAFIAFVMEILPLVGPWIAFIPALFVGLTDGFWTAVQVSMLYLGIQAFENYVVTPVVHGRQAQMPALLVLSSLLIGGSLMGIWGALVAIPVAVILHILFFQLVVPWTERQYGAPAPTASGEE